MAIGNGRVTAPETSLEHIRRRTRRGALVISVLYVFVGAAWIATSDRIVELMGLDPVLTARLQTYKGWFYVIMTGVILHRLIQSQTERVYEALEQRDLFASVASHEFKTPLTAISMQLGLLSRAFFANSTTDELRERVGKFIESAQRQLRRMNRLTEDLVDAQKLKSGRALQYNFESFDLSVLVDECIEDHSPLYSADGAPLIGEVAPGIQLKGDRERIAQMIFNLVNNAEKFGKRRPVTLKLSQYDEAGNAWARLEISDQATGLSDSDRKLIFLPFRTGVSAANYGGVGLGLFMADEIARAHGGRIRALDAEDCAADSFDFPDLPDEKSGGTRFEVLLPLNGLDS